LGRVTCRQLLEQGDDVIAVDHRFVADLAVPVHVLNVHDRMALYPLLAGCDAVVHLANHPDMRAGIPPQTIYSDNATADIHVFHAAIETGVRRIVYASSVQAISARRFGPQDLDKPSSLAYLPVDGEIPSKPGSLYALGKQGGEAMLRFYAGAHPDRSLTAIRFPWMPATVSSLPLQKRTVTLGRLDELFAYLDLEDAAGFVRSVLAANRAGYACCHPASPVNVLGWKLLDVIRVFYPNVPLRRPASEITSLIDLEPLRAHYHWAPVRIHEIPVMDVEGVNRPA